MKSVVVLNQNNNESWFLYYRKIDLLFDIYFIQVNLDKVFEMCLNRDDMCVVFRFYFYQCR